MKDMPHRVRMRIVSRLNFREQNTKFFHVYLSRRWRHRGKNEMLVYKSEELLDEETNMHIFSSSCQKDEEIHSHDFLEIIYITGGSAAEYVSTEVYEVRRGDLIFINYGSTHRFHPHKDFSYINICFDPETLGRRIITPENAFAVLQLTAFDEIRREGDGGMVSFGAGERAEVEGLLNSMLREYSERGASWKTVLESYMNILMVRILRKLSSSGEAAKKGSDDGVWRELCDYIDSNIGAELTLSSLAGRCFYNPSYFSRIFKEKFSMSLTEYINRKKIDNAIKLAEDPRLSVENIAERAGFSSKSSLYRVFLKVTGTSFSDFRKQK